MNLIIDHRIGVVDVKYFNEVDVVLKYDSIASSFGLKYYYDPTNKEHAEMAATSHFHECILKHNGETLITGFIINQGFDYESKKELATLSGYSKTGVLEDCDIPNSLYPLQSDGLTLKEITNKLIAPFKIKLVVDGRAFKDSVTAFTLDEKLDEPIKKSTATETQRIKAYLTSLAIQRNIILSHNEFGNLRFTEPAVVQKPIFHVGDGVIGTSIRMAFNGQGMHSQIEVVKQADSDDSDAGYAIIKNPYCPIVFRPKVIVQSSGDTNTTEQFAKNALAVELKNINFTVNVDRWDINNKLIRPGELISILSPENYIYEKTNLFIESVRFTGNEKKQTATLTCVLPEVYNGQTPKNIFIKPHENLPRF